jgi:hypothetical protein
MKSKRRGVKINCQTFRVLPDPVVDLWRDGRLQDSSVKVWVLMQRAAYDCKGEVGFNTLQRYCRVGRATLSRALKQLTELGLIQRSGQVYTVVFDQPTSSIMEPRGSTMEPTSSIMEPRGSTMEPNLSSNRGGELWRHVDTIGDSPETPPVRCAASLDSRVPITNGAQAANSHIHISDSDLALLAQRYNIRFQRPPSEVACVFIRNLLDLDDKDGERGKGLVEIVRAFAERTNGFGGGECSATAERNTIGGAQP